MHRQYRATGAKGGESKTSFDGLLKWVAEYRMRTNNWNSFEAHARLFGGFAGRKALLSSRVAVSHFADIAIQRQEASLR